MKVLFIGGTGNISTDVSKLAVLQGMNLYHLNRGTSGIAIEGVHTLKADINDRETVIDVLSGHEWDAVVNWIAYHPEEVLRDEKIFSDKTRQYIFISSASCYQKPLQNPNITEDTPLVNPYWEYSREKIACENALIDAYRKRNFPVTIVRPSHTYAHMIPVAIGGSKGYTIPARMLQGKPVLVHGDGTSLWALTHAEDFAVGFLGLIGKKQALGEAYHITSDERLNWNNIYHTLAEALGVEANLVHVSTEMICRIEPWFRDGLMGDKMESVIFDNSKIKSLVPEFEAGIRYREGLQKVLKWYEEHPGNKVVDEEADARIDKVLKACNYL